MNNRFAPYGGAGGGNFKQQRAACLRPHVARWSENPPENLHGTSSGTHYILEQWYPTQYVHLTLHPKGGQQAGTVKAGSFTVRVCVCVERVGWCECWGLDGEQRYGLHCSKRWERRFVCTQKFFARWRTNPTRPSRSRFFVNLKQTCIKWLEASNLLVGLWSLNFQVLPDPRGFSVQDPWSLARRWHSLQNTRLG